ncbi:MAG: DUF7742 family protein [Sulfitobacter sp.]
MRALHCVDLSLAARALCAAPPPQRAALAKTLCAQADLADRYRKRLGKIHPKWGDGSLAAAAFAAGVAPPRPWGDAAMLGAIQLITLEIQRRRAAHLRGNSKQIAPHGFAFGK